MTDENRQHGDPESRGGRADRKGDKKTVGNPPDPSAPEPAEAERGGSHGAQSASRINEDEGPRGES